MNAPGRRATIVAFYRSDPLNGLVTAVQAQVAAAFGEEFRPRPPETVHATIIGLERRIGNPGRDGVEQVAGYLDSTLRREPLWLRFGGFAEDARHSGFDDEGTLFDQTLFLQDRNVVLMGWPVDPADPDRPTNRLAELRKGCERYGFVHKYHDPDRPELLDPDAYLVLGRLRAAEQGAEQGALDDLTRSGPLARPTLARLRPADLSIVEFEDPELPLATSSATPLLPAG